MDPNATLKGIEEIICANEDKDGKLSSKADMGEANSLCEDLKRWIDQGGFQPNWLVHRKATAYFFLGFSGLVYRD